MKEGRLSGGILSLVGAIKLPKCGHPHFAVCLAKRFDKQCKAVHKLTKSTGSIAQNVKNLGISRTLCALLR